MADVDSLEVELFDLFHIIGFFYLSLWSADFLTGLFHWFEDAYCVRGLPFVGELICDPNLDHHIDPGLMVRTGSFVSRNSLQWIIAATAVILILAANGEISMFVLATIVLASFGNEIHRWNHTTKNPAWIELIKSTGVIQSQRQHSLHHKPPHDSNYCVMTSQLNPILDAIGFWRWLELILSPVLDVKRSKG